MLRCCWAVIASLLLASPADVPKPASRFEAETLHYNVNWPSGLSLGEAQLTARKSGERWSFEMQLDAGIPGFAVRDSFSSSASGEFCSAEFAKKAQHGKRKTDETITFDQSRGIATRQTAGGGKSEISIPSCAKDALAYLYYVRHELGSGRVPPAQSVMFGAAYQVRLEYAGEVSTPSGDARVPADKLTGRIKGPASEHTIEFLFARDPVRTPLLIRVPLPLGSFSMELVR